MFEMSADSYWSVVRPNFLVCFFIKAFSSLKGMFGAVHKKQSFDRLKHNWWPYSRNKKISAACSPRDIAKKPYSLPKAVHKKKSFDGLWIYLVTTWHRPGTVLARAGRTTRPGPFRPPVARPAIAPAIEHFITDLDPVTPQRHFSSTESIFSQRRFIETARSEPTSHEP